MENNKSSKKEKKSVGRIIVDILVWILFAIIIAEAAVGIINMQRINDEKKPVWYLNKKEVVTENKKEITYNLGLYKIVKTDTAKETKTTLKPFFMN